MARISAWFEQKYIKNAMHVLQAEGFLMRQLTSREDAIKGNIVNWRFVGTGAATLATSTIENLPTMNTDRTSVQATMQDWEANDFVSKQMDLEKTSETEQQKIAETAAFALGRTFDQQHFKVLDTVAGGITTIGTGIAITPQDLLASQAVIMAAGVNGPTEIYVALPYLTVSQLLLYREFSSRDYVGDEQPLLKKLNAFRWLGMMIIPMPDSYFAVPSAGQADGYMWLKSCLGCASNYELNARIDYIAEKGAWFSRNTIGFIAKELQTAGIRRLRFANSSTLSRPSP